MQGLRNICVLIEHVGSKHQAVGASWGRVVLGRKEVSLRSSSTRSLGMRQEISIRISLHAARKVLGEIAGCKDARGLAISIV